jgi:4-amino-4-deoxychorismate lyase
MSQFFETIKYHQGEFYLLDYHEERLNETRRKIFGSKDPIRLLEFLHNTPADNQIYRCRISYTDKIEKIEFFTYQLATHKTVHLFKSGNYKYNLKSENRVFLTEALKEKGGDDVIFLNDNGVQDATYSNLIFSKNRQWYTPKTYLLNGVKRKFLLNYDRIKEEDIGLNDLAQFEKIAFINAMRDFELVYSFELKNDEMKLTLIQ